MLHAFDKHLDKQFQVTVADAAAEKGFYSYKTKDAAGCEEELFAGIESKAGDPISQIVRERRLRDLSQQKRTILAMFAAAQMVRSKNSRAINDQIGEMLRKLADREGSPEFKAWVGTKDEAEETKHEITSLRRRIVGFAPFIASKDFLLFTTRPDSPMLIGDSPLTRTNTLNQSEFVGTNGIASQGVEIYLPLSPSLAIGFMCPSIRESMRKVILLQGRQAPTVCFDYLLAFEKGTPINLDKPHVDFINSHQVLAAERFVYSASDDFALVREMVSSNPAAREGHRLMNNQNL